MASGGQASQEPAGNSSREIEPNISDLARVQITMMLEQLLRLVPRFRKGLHRTLEGATASLAAPVRLTKIDQRVMDCDCSNMEAIVGGPRITRILIDDGSSINVISMSTCRRLGNTQWEQCTFWLRMADGISVRPVGMIPDLDMVV
jgi:hypothetical protein